MAYFWYKGQQIFFSLCKEGEWLGNRVIEFDYQDEVFRIGKSELDEEVWGMLLQVLNLDAT